MVIERNVLKNCLKKKRVSNSNKEIGQNFFFFLTQHNLIQKSDKVIEEKVDNNKYIYIYIYIFFLIST